MNADHQLLFAVLAFQDEFIDLSQFSAACNAWAANKSRPIAELLIERGWITASDREHLNRLAERKVKRYGGDARAALGVVATPEIRDIIRGAEDEEIRQSVSSMPPAAGHVLVETLMRPTDEKSRYTLSRLHGEGGLGKVWLAHDRELNRQVALKEIRSEKARHPEAWRRFLKEAQITGQLEHPNIVPVYDLARRREDEQPFYTMKFVRGQTLRDALRDYHRRCRDGTVDPMELRRLLGVFVSVCNALGYAHSRGVLHRDLKPSNIVLGGFGEVLVLDWGLAKIVGSADVEASTLGITDEAQMDATATGRVLGTPSYMAPEQADGRLDLLDARTDIYGLGAILFEILAGRAPHEGDNTDDILRRIVDNETPRARAVHSSVPLALDAIAAKAMAKSQAARYPKAADLADDVQRWLADEPVSVVREPFAVRAGRWARRRKTAVFSAAALLVTVSLALSISTAIIGREHSVTKEALKNEKKATQDANVAKNTAQAQRELAEELAKNNIQMANEQRQQRVRLNIAYGARLLEEGDLLASLPWFAEALAVDKEAGPDQNLVHRVRLGAVIRQAPRLVQTLFGDAPVTFAEFSPDGKWVALVVPAKGAVRVLESSTGVPVSPTIKHRGPTVRAGFSPDGRRLLTANTDGGVEGNSEIRLWDPASGIPLSESVRLNGTVVEAAFSADGQRVVTASRVTFGEGGSAQVWNGETLKPISPVMKHDTWVTHAAFSPEGDRIATVCLDGSTRVWSAEKGELVAGPIVQKVPLGYVSFSPDGTRVATASNYGVARVWDAANGEPAAPPLEHRGAEFRGPTDPGGRPLAFVAFSSDGRRLVTVCGDRTARVWDPVTGQPISMPLKHADDVVSARFNPNGTLVLTASLDLTARIWNADTGDPAAPPLKHSDAILHADWARDGNHVITVSRDTTARVWDLSATRPRTPLVEAGAKLRFGTTSPDVLWIATADTDNNVQVWDALTGKATGITMSHPLAVEHIVFSRDSRRIVIASGITSPTGEARVWDVLGGQALSKSLNQESPIHRIAFSPDAKFVVTAGGRTAPPSGEAKLWNVETGELVRTIGNHRMLVTDVAFDSAGDRIVTGSLDGTARIHNVATGEFITPPLSHQRFAVMDVDFSPDGKLVLTASGDGTARLWDADTGKEGFTFKHDRELKSALFNPSGDRIVTASADRTARVWNVQTGEPVTPPLRHQRELVHATFGMDGKLVATTAADYTARVWDAATGLPVSPWLRHLAPQVERAQFSPDGTRLFTSNVFRIWTWDLSPEFPASETLVRLAEWTAGQLVDENGGFVPIDFSDMVKLMTTLIDIQPRQWPLHHRRGRAFADRAYESEKKQDWESAIADFTRALQLGANDRELWFDIGNAHYALRDFGSAVRELTRAIELGLDEARVWSKRGHAHLGNREPDKAVADFSKYIDRALYAGTPYLNRGFAYAELDRWADARADYERGIRLETQTQGDHAVPMGFRYQLALTHLGGDDRDGYRKVCASLIERFGRTPDADAGYFVAWTCSVAPDAVTDFDRVVALAEKALAADPENASYLNSLGAALYRKGDFKQAAERLKAAVAMQDAAKTAGKEVFSSPVYPRLFLALAFVQLGDTAEAKKWLDDGVKWAEQPPPSPDPPPNWVQRLVIKLLRREAEARLKQSSP